MKINEEKLREEVQRQLNNPETLKQAMKYCLDNKLITQQQVQKAQDRNSKLKLMSKAVAFYLNRQNP